MAEGVDHQIFMKASFIIEKSNRKQFFGMGYTRAFRTGAREVGLKKNLFLSDMRAVRDMGVAYNYTGSFEGLLKRFTPNRTPMVSSEISKLLDNELSEASRLARLAWTRRFDDESVIATTRGVRSHRELLSELSSVDIHGLTLRLLGSVESGLFMAATDALRKLTSPLLRIANYTEYGYYASVSEVQSFQVLLEHALNQCRSQFESSADSLTYREAVSDLITLDAVFNDAQVLADTTVTPLVLRKLEGPRKRILEACRVLLSKPHLPIEATATSTGFASHESTNTLAAICSVLRECTRVRSNKAVSEIESQLPYLAIHIEPSLTNSHVALATQSSFLCGDSSEMIRMSSQRLTCLQERLGPNWQADTITNTIDDLSSVIGVEDARPFKLKGSNSELSDSQWKLLSDALMMPKSLHKFTVENLKTCLLSRPEVLRLTVRLLIYDMIVDV